MEQWQRPYFTLVLCLVIGIAWKLVPHPVVAIAIGLLPFAILVVLRFPFIFVLMFVVFSFFRIHEVIPQLYSLKIPLLLSLASLSALIWHVGFTRKIQVYWSKELTVASIFFLLVIIGVVMASNRPIAIQYFKNIYWKIAIMTYAIAWLSRTADDFTLISRAITIAGVLVGLTALFNQANGIGMVEETRVTIGRELGSVLGDPNDLALVLMFPASFAVSLLLTQGMGRYTKLLGLVSVVVLFFAILATQSRGSLLGIMAVFGVFAYRRIQSKALFATLIIVSGALLYVMAGISDRSSGGAAEEGIDASAMGRLYAWEAAYKMAVSHPLTGVGLNNFYSNYYYYSPHWDGLNHAVHSTWFGVLAEVGFLGLAVFIYFIVILIRTSIHSLLIIEQSNTPVNPAIHATAQAVLAGLLGTIVSGTFLTQGFTWPIYILAALVVAVAQWVKTSLPDNQEPPPHNKSNFSQINITQIISLPSMSPFIISLIGFLSIALSGNLLTPGLLFPLYILTFLMLVAIIWWLEASFPRKKKTQKNLISTHNTSATKYRYDVPRIMHLKLQITKEYTKNLK